MLSLMRFIIRELIIKIIRIRIRKIIRIRRVIRIIIKIRKIKRISPNQRIQTSPTRKTDLQLSNRLNLKKTFSQISMKR